MSAALGATYYVDSVNGNDNNNGTSAATAWRTFTKVNSVTFQAGDEILLKAGCVWNDTMLWPKGSGSAGNPIVIDMYDTGAKPVINGNYANLQAVYLYNQQYWEISNLEVTNWNPGGKTEIRGIAVIGEDVGVLNHVYVRNCIIHDINGARLVGGDKGKCNAGIYYDCWGGSVKTHWNDVLIEGNTIYNVDMTGIKVWNGAWFGWKCHERDYHTNVVVRNNCVDNIGGDGITPHMCIAPLVEYNVASRCRQRAEGAAYVAIWTYEADDAVVQYNEAYLTSGTKDGQAYDIDGVQRRGIYQYNYSHDNDGGFILLCEEPGNACYYCDSPVVRYNISQNDGISGARTFHLSGKVLNAQIYNNTIYRGPSVGANVVENFTWKGTSALNTRWWNNVFYNLGSGDYVDVLRNGAVWDYNLFYGNHPPNEPPDAHKLTSDPQFVNPGSGGVGRDTVDGYKLLSTSPCRDSGVTVADNGGKDYWGNPVPANGVADRGAFEYPTGPQPPIADFSGNPTSGMTPLTVAFTDLSAYNPTSWSWTFGDGGTSTARNPSHTYNSGGVFTVSLTATNSAGSDTCTKPDYITANAPLPPVADFVGAPTSGNAPLTANFTGQSTNAPTSWSWTFGDGGSSSAQNPGHTYNNAGQYTVGLTATNAYGSNTKTKTNYITVTSGGGGDYSCASATIEVGTLVSGDHTSTHVSDDLRMVCDAVKTGGKYDVHIAYTFETGLASLSALTVTDEIQASSLPRAGYHYRYVDVWNYSTSAWEQVSRVRISSAGVDVTTVTSVPSPGSYVSGTGQVKVRTRYGGMSVDPWAFSVDLMKITAAP